MYKEVSLTLAGPSAVADVRSKAALIEGVNSVIDAAKASDDVLSSSRTVNSSKGMDLNTFICSPPIVVT
ncbi:hypothetical protein D3C78_1911430 [compost metagenome]